ncbi:MAG: hypothetical protein LBQ09_07010, partial [Acidobacteriaceae bacterium]|nr:hypothetical protein [Acidobacteriaceae bacterium]
MTRFHRHAIVVLFVLVTVGRAFAQTPTAESLYADAVAKEKAVRAALDQPSPSVTLIRALRTVVSDYETIARRYPASHNSDDALWRGAMLARDGFHAFRQAREQTDAIRLLQVLPVQYPASPFAKQSAAELASLKAAKPAATIQLPEPARTPSAPPVIATAPTPVAIASDAIVQTPSPADLVAAEEIAPPAPSAPPAT